jgi:glycosyltransferase involved in cell wall biosynthesis
MFKEQPIPSFDPEWEIPRAFYFSAFNRKTRFCIVIPVINEGEKIRRQLRRMADLDLPRRADILIADGGSNDGSLAPEFLDAIGVRALLIKEDAGKLGAQLRIGYAFALQEGYDGIVTVDGNDKDSMKSIPLFLDALDRGVDYAQGSRYVLGGRAVNTPRVRHFAMRLLHAPAVSLAAGRRFTDTTNGFRAYSRRYLLHPQVLPFRGIFQTYELLAYLSARASRLGLAVEEVPVTRSYPASGPIPTKISSVRGNLLLVRILLRLLIGGYNPGRSRG